MSDLRQHKSASPPRKRQRSRSTDKQENRKHAKTSRPHLKDSPVKALLVYAGLGKLSRAKRLIKKTDVDVDAIDAEGSTPLHQVRSAAPQGV